MRKHLTKFGLLLFLGVFLSSALSAQMNYQLDIVGTQVNSNNAGDLSVIDGVTGIVTYDYTTKTLTLNNATLSASEFPGISNTGIEDFKIMLIGSNTINARGGIEIVKNTEISGTGSISITSTQREWPGIYILAPLTIKDCSVDVVGEAYGIAGYRAQSGTKLIIDNATVKATGTMIASISDIASLTLNSCSLVSPDGAAYDASLYGVAINNELVKEQVVIGQEYRLKIAGTQVNSANANDLSVINGVSGTVTYDNDTKTLTLDNATINVTYTGLSCIRNELISDLKINLIGTNTISNNSFALSSIIINEDTEITGTGSLTANNPNNGGAYLYKNKLKITGGCTVEFSGKSGISGHSDKDAILEVDNSTLKATGVENGSIYDIGNLVLHNCLILSPEGATFSLFSGAVYENGIVKEQVAIGQEYGLKIAGTLVTSANANDLSVIDGVSGTVTYDNDTKTLTLNNATINKNNAPSIHNKYISDLKINLIGTNTISRNSPYSCMLVDRNTEITGTGSLTVNNPSGGVAHLANKELKITGGCSVEFFGKKGIRGANLHTASLVVENSTLKATITETPSIYHIGSLTLNDCKITAPTGAAFDENLHGVALNGSLVTEQVIIEPIEKYELEIAGTQVTEENADDLSVIDGVTGTASYNNATKTLTLNNATIVATGNDNCIFNDGIDDLKIKLIGNNSLTSFSSTLYVSEYNGAENTEIIGNGNLNLESTANEAIYLYESHLKIKNGSYIEALGATKGVTGYGIYTHLEIDNATFKVQGNNGSIDDMADLTLNNCKIISPAGATHNSSTGAVENNGSIVTEQIVIRPIEKYELYIAGVQVTENNAADLSVIDGVSGTVSYNDATKTLTLDNATIDASGKESAIEVEIEDFKINLTGTNEIDAEDYPLNIYDDTEISGNGSLKITSNDIAIYITECLLTIKDCTIEAIGTNNGITGEATINDKLSIENATVKAIGSDGSIIGLGSLTITNCEITNPAGAIFNADQHAVVLNEEIVTGQIVIRPIEKYELRIAGVQVTELNAGDLSVIEGVSGTVSYDNNTKTLTLEDANINTPHDHAIAPEIDGLKITFKGTNNLTSGQYGIDIYKKTEINGTGSVFITTSAFGIVLNNSPLTIKNCTVEAVGQEYGIAGYNNAADKLEIENATVKAIGSTEGSISRLESLTLNACSITTPAGATFDANQHAVTLNGEIVKNQIVIEPLETYELWIAGEQVTENNADDLSVIEGVTGTVTYNNTTKTLTLDGATIAGGNIDDANISIYSKIENLKISLINTNTLNATGAGIAFLEATSEINGQGTLNALGMQNFGIGFSDCNLTIKDCSINVQSDGVGLAGTGEDNETLTIDNATVKATGTNECSMGGFSELVLNNCAITAPEGAAFDANELVVMLNGEAVTEQIVIEPLETYELWIAGEQVTENNADDLSVIDGVTGTVTYNNTTKTLTLDGATIAGGDIDGANISIHSKIEDLKITLINTNTLNGTGAGLYLYEAAAEINGQGILNSLGTQFFGIGAGDCHLTIKDCSINVQSDGIGIAGTETKILTIDNATVKATGTNECSMGGFSELVLNNCAITAPEGAAFDANELVVMLNGEAVTEQIVIEPVSGIQEAANMLSFEVYPNPAGNFVHININDTKSNDLKVQVYDILGKLVKTQPITERTTQLDIQNLKSGVYILKVGNSSKRLIKK